MAGRVELTTEKKLNKYLEEGEIGPSNAPPTKPLIRRVAHTLRVRYDEEECKRYFEPISIPIGPLHHKKDPKFEIGEDCKLQLAAMFIKYSGRTKEDFYNNVKKEINSLRKCYDLKEVEKWNDEELAWMFLVDGCALLQFIFLDVNDMWKDLLGGKKDRVAFAKLDLFLLENQLPYQLLEILIGSCTRVPSEEGGANPQEELKDSIIKFINKSFLSPFEQQQQQIQMTLPHKPQQQKDSSSYPPAKQQQIDIEVDSDQTHPPHGQRQEEEEPAHLLALLRRGLIGVKSKGQDENQKQYKKSPSQQLNEKDGLWRRLMMNTKLFSKSRHWYKFRNVKELKANGIGFKARENEGVITKIGFNNCCFCLPTLTLAPILVDDTTMPKLLNLIAFEMCPDFKNEYEITSFVSFLDSLIDSAEDVKELRDAGVLHNALGSDQAVAVLFNKISDNLVPNLDLHSKLKDRIQEHCNRVWARDVAQIYHTYFRTPWSFIVFLGVVAGLVMTGVQTYNSFFEEKPAGSVVNYNYYYYYSP